MEKKQQHKETKTWNETKEKESKERKRKKKHKAVKKHIFNTEALLGFYAWSWLEILYTLAPNHEWLKKEKKESTLKSVLWWLRGWILTYKYVKEHDDKWEQKQINTSLQSCVA